MNWARVVPGDLAFLGHRVDGNERIIGWIGVSRDRRTERSVELLAGSTCMLLGPIVQAPHADLALVLCGGRIAWVNVTYIRTAR